MNSADRINRMTRLIFVLTLLGAFACSWAQSTRQSDEPHLVTRARYKIQAGDRFDVSYRYTPELNQAVTVEPDGFVNLDPAGAIKVSGLTLEQATELITGLASKHLHDPKVTLTLKEFHKPYYVVAGEVKHPGRFDMDQPTTALQAVLVAGGMDTTARSSQVILFRRINADDDEVHVLDLHNIKKRSDLEHDIMLEPGDMLLIPRDRIAKMDRIIKATNIGLYLNPGQLGF
jgi:polysaccharide export outer membrane protein